MGWGDEIMAAGMAREMFELRPHRGRVIILDRFQRVRSHDAWMNNPQIATPGTHITSNANVIVNGGGIRPYIKGKTTTQWMWCDYRNPPGKLYLSIGETRFARGYAPTIIVEPNIKPGASPNKDWGWDRWQTLVNILKANVSQLGPFGTRKLDGVTHIITPNMRLAAAVVANARLVITSEGGLHHTAAAVGTRAIVLYGGFISPKQTGYKLHHNIFTGGVPCGMRVPCEHCREAMAQITPQEVAEHAFRILKESNETASRDLAA